MRSTFRRILAALGRQELLLVVLIAVLIAVVSTQSPSFFHIETLFNVLRGSMVSVVFGLAVLLVLLAGGIDVSFLTIGIFAAYLTVQLVPQDGPIQAALIPFVLSTVLGACLGLLNAAVVLGARVSTLIATLATSAIYTGVMFVFIGGKVIPQLPKPLQLLGATDLFTAPAAARGTTRLNVLIILVALVCVAMAAFLRFTVTGRSIFAVGGDALAASRAAVSVPRIRVYVFVLAGMLSGLAGILHVTLSGRADPTTFTGQELSVIAAVVLGGAAITGGKGSVSGTVLGVLMIALISTSLVPLGVPSLWQQTTVGVLLIVGVSLQTFGKWRKPVRSILEDVNEERS